MDNKIIIKNIGHQAPSVGVVICKPTRACNADCDFCSSPPYDVNQWSIEDFKFYFDKLSPSLTDNCMWIWHGGEPMLMGVEFYKSACEYARTIKPNIRFSMQTNLLLYNDDWKDIILDIFDGSLSTSYDPDEQDRTIKGNSEIYNKRFLKKLDQSMRDGIYPMVIGTFSADSIGSADLLYDLSLEYEYELGRGFPIRLNYRYPAGRESSELISGNLLSPSQYGAMLLRLYDKWIVDLPNFTITPLDQMFNRVVGVDSNRCPWLNNCGGRFLGLEPNGDVYNCSDFADLREQKYCFGNLKVNSLQEIFSSDAMRLIRHRRVDVPDSCRTCSHYSECQGGCVRDSVLYNRGLGGKFYYCESWMMVFNRIKETLRSGDALLAKNKYK
ncbi:radical SAM protein [Photobacterium leiognathi]|uniref:radical SAM protein n=1 Tax=Photobacterium leiognathi TaxID=553611 RepID=UPI00298140D9|nr:radical SAM protein [Photobacterium leiognathi]